MASHAPLDDWSPLDPTQRAAQVLGLREWLMQRERRDDLAPRVLDLGCGDGCVIESLLAGGGAFLGLDADARARRAARRRLRGRRHVEIIDADFLDPEHAARWPGPFDLALCLGHTLMLVIDDDEARGLFERLAARLRAGGAFAMDDFPDELQALVACGAWQTGLSEDGSCQMILDAARRLVALRYGEEIDESCETFRPGERLHRLWTMEELEALAGASGLRPPRRDPAHHLIWFDRS